MSLDRLIGNLEKWQDNGFYTIIGLAVDEEELITSLNQERVSERSQYVSGELITPIYSKATQRRKKKVNPDLYETGSFLRSTIVEVSPDGDSFLIYSLDDKYEAGVLGIYEVKGDIFGLSESDLEILGAAMKPKLIEEFRKMVLS